MLSKVVFDKTAFVKFKITNNCKQNTDETDFCQIFVISNKNP